MKIPWASDRKFWGLVIVALVLRSGALMLHPRIHGGGDQGLHYVLGVLVAHLGTGHLGWWPPGYEVFLGGVFALFGPDPLAARIIQVLLSTATVGLVYGIVVHEIGRRAARIAAGLCAVYPSLIAFSHYLYGETLFIFLLVAFLYVFVRFPERKCLHRFGGGVLLGFCILTRSAVLWFLPLWIGWELVRGRRRQAIEIASALAVALVVILPWTARNAVKYGGFLLIDGTMGRTAYLSTSLEEEGLKHGNDLGFKRGINAARTRAPCGWRPLKQFAPLPPVAELKALFPPATSLPVLFPAPKKHARPARISEEVLSVKLRKARERAALDLIAQQRCEPPLALAAISSDPGRWARAVLQRVYQFWGPNSFLLRTAYDGSYGDGPLSHYEVVKWGFLVSYAAVMIAAVLALARRSPPRLVEWSILFSVYYCALHAMAIASSRYRLPVMLFAIMLASTWIAQPRWPEGRNRFVLVCALLVSLTALFVHYLIRVLP